MRVYFVGAGPGDADLLTLKGKALIEEADVIVYAGSLVNPEVLRYAKKEAVLYDSSGMTLEEITRVMVKAVKQGKTVVRLQSGDPGLYSALGEQVRALNKEGVEGVVVPGVSSFQAAAASLGVEYTVPGVVQTLILTRMGGRTRVPGKESLRELARHRASMGIFLSAHRIKEVVGELLESYPPSTPAAVVYKASWRDERVIRGSLGEIAEKAGDVGRTALILVGDFLEPPEARSRLYDASFEHGYRRKR